MLPPALGLLQQRIDNILTVERLLTNQLTNSPDLCETEAIQRGEVVGETVGQVTSHLVRAMIEERRKFWGVIRGLKGGSKSKDIPGWMSPSTGMGKVIEDRKGLEALWKQQYERVPWTPKTADSASWHRKVIREVAAWEKGREASV